MKIAAVQFIREKDIEKNKENALYFIEESKLQSADLVVFPEMFLFLVEGRRLIEESIEMNSDLICWFRTISKKYNMNIIWGSIPLIDKNKKKPYNALLFIDNKGKIKSIYRKRNLFKLKTDNIDLDESRYLQKGREITLMKFRGFNLSFHICYDLRFSSDFLKAYRKGAEVYIIPSNFTYYTGRMHWETLLRARAIEFKAYIIAPDIAGTNPWTKVKSYGNTMCIDPTGKIISRLSSNKKGIIYCDIEKQRINKIRCLGY